ncbi:hypothetical protein [Caballeronia sp. INSB1]|uniref:hypothetical protein n=1 Tax=Caballeronia sp. INSB1 TaxID=2921751 RepID=UPI002032D012|nr:hypothetical protein [Caballeronia sp. INSB1]
MQGAQNNHTDELSNMTVSMPRKRRFTKLKASELSGLPGAIPTRVKPVERDVAYIQFVVPLTGLVGTANESGEVIDFATRLNLQGENLGVGTVSRLGFGDGLAEILLQLNASVDPENPGAAAADAFNKLNSFLDSASQLRIVRAGRGAAWKAKINGTTIADGRY